MNAARIASLADEEIRILVSRIKGARKNMRDTAIDAVLPRNESAT